MRHYCSLFIIIPLTLIMGWFVTATTTYAALTAVLEPNGLVLPNGQLAEGFVQIQGMAQHATFRKWQIDLLLHGEDKQAIFIAFGEKERRDLDRLTTLDTTLYPNGSHLLRLRVVHSNLNYDEYFTPITIENSNPRAPMRSPILIETIAEAPPVTSFVPTVPLGQGIGDGERRIEVDLSEQMLIAWQGDTIVLRTSVSTGRAEYPTVIGTWPIRTKLTSTRMIGPGYDTPNVPWTMYFYRGYAIHGAYWHNDFGTPVSHGCINMRPDEAKLLFDWALEGMSVTVHE